ncbi:Na+-driven multidrug efflux pump [Prevotella sp. khp1]|nr:polysaccharide biosynthesis protein [Xylanibacter ruminicola]SDQ22743.1 Na+-driven multidrug efflux pump [Prevotella sp. khp1]
MSENYNNNRRIAKNTIFLYIRMGLSMAVSLYTSRIVLQTLGVEDYGIYGVVGGVVSMFSFLNASMSGATSRFLTYELGKGDNIRLHKTFCMAFYEHLIIAGVIFLICETFGLWFLNSKLIIPPDRLLAANWVFQLSILSMIIGVTQVPYNASIISHERMDIYAYVEMINVCFRLLIVYLLQIFLFDKLILYSILVFIVSLGVAMYYRIYCLHHFSESKLLFIWDYPLLKRMFSFSGWDLYGNLSVTARTQGVNMLLNMFFGPVVNAAASISMSVQSSVMGFATNVLTAVKPQIIKYYAQESYNEMIHLIRNAVRLNFLLLMFITIPLMIELPFVLHLWLGEVPDFTYEFCSLTLLFNFFANMSHVIITGIHATGKIKRASLINGTLYLLVIPISYFVFRLGGVPWIPYFINVVAVFCGMLSNAITLHLYVRQFSVVTFLMKDLIPCISVFVITYIICMVIHHANSNQIIRFLVTILSSSLLLLVLGYYFLLPKSLSKRVIYRIKNRFIWKKV